MRNWTLITETDSVMPVSSPPSKDAAISTSPTPSISSTSPTRPRCLIDFPWQETRLRLAFHRPVRLLQTDQLNEIRTLIAEAETLAKQGFWLVGYVAYEAAPAFDDALHVRSERSVSSSSAYEAAGATQAFPLLWFAVFDTAPSDWPDFETEKQLATDITWSAGLSAEQHALDVMDLRQQIAAGVAYQINHTLRLEGQLEGDTLPHFLRLHRRQPQTYAAWLELDAPSLITAAAPLQSNTRSVLSLSPELFFSRHGNCITTRPMKGTAARGRWSQEDASQAENLRICPKNRAENLMIVDLLRNDLSRIARPHSVTVDSLFALEQHPSLWQMTSTIRAQMRDQLTLVDLFQALFPCGSVTGAPKAKAMELIARKETSARGLYCGAIGLLQPGGDAVFNVAIRTITTHGSQARCGVGGAITWDSNASAEYAEALLKGRFLQPAEARLQTLALLGSETLFETLRLENGHYPQLDAHLERLSASATYFGLTANPGTWRQQLDELAQKHPHASYRVRLDFNAQKHSWVQITELPKTPVSARCLFSLAQLELPANSVWLHHKTSRRQHLENPLKKARQKNPAIFDVLLINERNELTEFTRGNLLLEIDGRLYTPPLSCGLLGGIARADWLARAQAGVQERVLHPEDLACAQHIFFLNSLRGLVKMSWHES